MEIYREVQELSGYKEESNGFDHFVTKMLDDRWNWDIDDIGDRQCLDA